MKIADVTKEIEAKTSRRVARQDSPAAPVAENAPEPARQVPAVSPAEVRKIESVTKQIDSFLRSMNRSLQFRVDESSGRMVVSITDSETGEVIRQVPGEDALRIAQSLESRLSGIVDEKV
jgi:flagellar protein FlaG